MEGFKESDVIKYSMIFYKEENQDAIGNTILKNT